ncbi:carboxymuconolactone decarboxylase family protein [Paracoccus sp. P2]|uniref:carboxymuconolactone decarboxylase family protein n=1 Tax=Paracoccus sp. P2 TaxID=3248840 RepID=UPI00391F394A
MTSQNGVPLDRLESHFTPDVVSEIKDKALFAAVDAFWASVYAGPHLSLRMKELVMVALHGSSSSLNKPALTRHIQRALAAGASESDVMDVLTTIIPLANHPLYIGIPVLQDELRKAGRAAEAEIPPMGAEAQAIKDDFVSRRGYWTAMRDTIGALMPTYFKGFITACMEPWESGSLTPAERELMYIAIDTSITHTYEPGMRMHIQNALRYGATPEQIMEVFQLAALLGTEGYVLGLQALADSRT